MSAAVQPVASPSRWLFGPGVDLFLGYGVAYMISIPVLVWLSVRGIGTPAEWVTPALALVFATPHYGATLLRVYQRAEDRRKYALFTVWLTLFMAASFVAGLWVPFIGSVLLTVYVTWSPWHFSGQNYGLFLMYLRRCGYDPEEIRRPLYLSFVFSAGLAILAMHMASSTGTFAARAADPSHTYAILRLGFSGGVATATAVAAAIGWLVCMGLVWVRLRGKVRFADVGPLGALVATQALWYLPSLGVVAGWFDPGRAGFAFTAIWIAVAHSAQYLWVTYYYARREKRHRNVASFYGMTMLGGAVLLAPILFLAPGLFGSAVPGAAGVAVLTIAVLNVHHFILDGAIWKLRDGRVARILLRDEEPGDLRDEEPSGAPPISPRFGFRPVRAAIWGLALLSLFAQVELVRLYRLATGESVEATVLLRTASTLAWFGQDTQALWARTGRKLEDSGDEHRALAAYRRSLRFGDPQPWIASRTARLLLEGPAAGEPGSLQEAHKLARYLVQRLGGSRPEGYQTLATVHEHAGRWDLAAEAAAHGLRIAEQRGDAEAAGRLRQQLEAYRRQGRAGLAPARPLEAVPPANAPKLY